ncbi:hypothetical protein [Winogradskyella sp. 3972H.M.0a.05]|uniref:tetratricopeptide repeat protein n=1 Tax=Winogradskyella sp. 3972H.M.0a.05 TaxID=2950277 RepID=UPI0033943164
MKQLIVISFILFSCALNFSCSAEKKAPVIIKSDENESKVIDLALAIQSSIEEGNAQDYLNLWDIGNFNNKVRKNMNSFGFNKYVESFISGLGQGLESFPNKIIHQYNEGAYYDFIKVRYDDDEQTYYMLFRFFSELEGINYHDYSVSVEDGEVKFNDMYVYLTGEHFANTIARFGLFAFPKRNLFSSESTLDDKIKEFEHIQKSVEYQQSGQFEKAYKEISKVKSDLSKNKALLLVKLQYAVNYDLEIYKSSIEEIMSLFPNDETLNILYIDYYSLLEDYDKAIEYIDELEQLTEDDFVRILKAHTYYNKGEQAKALEHYDYIIDNYGFFGAYSGKIAVLTEQEKYETAVELLQQLIDSGDYVKQDLIVFIEEVDENGENILLPLVESEVYKAWKE